MASPQKPPKEISTRKNFDKRTIRKMYSQPFEYAISKETGRRSEEGSEAVLQYSAQVMCRAVFRESLQQRTSGSQLIRHCLCC